MPSFALLAHRSFMTLRKLRDDKAVHIAESVKPESILCPSPAGPLLPAGRFLYRSHAAGGARGDHPRPFRSCARAATARCWPRPRRSPSCRRAMASFAGSARGRALRPDRSDRDGVEVTLVPAGHVLGSAQAVIRWKGLTIVVSGDYKRRRDPTCPPFEPVPCDVFVTEATFGLPVFCFPGRQPRNRQAAEIGGAVSGAHASGRRLCARQSAARDPPACAKRATTSRSTSTARSPA